MEIPLQQMLTEVLEKIRRADERRRELEEELLQARKEAEQLQSELRQTREEATRLRSERDFLEISRRLADTPEALIKSRRHIATLIRRIESSIKRLEEDAAL